MVTPPTCVRNERRYEDVMNGQARATLPQSVTLPGRRRLWIFFVVWVARDSLSFHVAALPLGCERSRGASLFYSPLHFRPICKAPRRRQAYMLSSLFAEQEDGENSQVDNNSPENNIPPPTAKAPMGHAGGRAPRKTTIWRSRGFKNDWTRLIVPLFAILFLVGNMFFWGILGRASDPSSSHVYFYESTISESRVYDSATGKVETSRQERVRSNVPSAFDGTRSPNLYHSAESSFEKDLEQELESIAKFQRTILREFF